MFDPYHKWLGILPKYQPPNHYRLLSLEPFESDLDVIEGAADRQMSFVRQYQSGERAADAARILNELALARLCLLKPSTKSTYDAELRRLLEPAEPEFPDLPFSIEESAVKPRTGQRTKKSSKGKNAKNSGPPVLLMIGGGAAVIVVAILAMFMFSGRPKPRIDRPAEIVAATPVNPNTAAATPVKPNIADVKPNPVSEAEQLSKRLDVEFPATPQVDAPIIPVIAEIEGKESASVVPRSSLSVGEPSSPATSGTWIDLLEWTEGVDWSSRGINWNNNLKENPTRDGIIVKKGPEQRFPLPAIIDGDYEMEVEFTRLEGDDAVSIHFPVGIHTMRLLLGSEHGAVSQLAFVDGRAGIEQRPAQIPNNQPHRVFIQVQKSDEKIAINIDWDANKDYLKWEGPSTALTDVDPSNWKTSMIQHPWVGGLNGSIVFRKVRVRMLSGTIVRDSITAVDREQDLSNGIARLVGEKASAVHVGWWNFVVNQIPLDTPPGGTERRWPLITRDFKFCNDFYNAHAPSRLKCRIPARAKSFSVVGTNEASRTAKFQIVIDGKHVYDSREVGIAVIKVDIAPKSSVLELVTDPGGEKVHDHTYWSFPRFHVVDARMVTDQMLDGKPGPLKFKLEPIEGGTPVHNLPIDGLKSAPVHFRDAQPCHEFLFTHAPSTATYQVPKGMTRFTAIGMAVHSHSVKFEVRADAERVFESPEAGIIPVDVRLPPGTKTIELKVNDLGDNGNDIGLWCYPRLHRE